MDQDKRIKELENKLKDLLWKSLKV
jgi:hypothetical protein